MTEFKAFHSVKATLDGIETVHMSRKRQLSDENVPAYKQFCFSRIIVSADKCSFSFFEYLRQSLRIAMLNITLI